MTWLQRWTDALFLHFPVPAEEMTPLVPRNVEIDTFGGQAWLSYVFFRLKLRPVWLPFVPGLSSLVELNVRIYVRHRGRAGICFLRMYADNRLAIRAARLLTPLCYEPATMIDERKADGTRHIECRPADSAAGILSVEFAVHGTPAEAATDSLDAWLLERYSLFVANRDGSLSVAEVEHLPWRTSSMETTAVNHSLSRSLGFSLNDQPTLMHYSPGVAARFKAFHVVAMAEEGMGNREQRTGCGSGPARRQWWAGGRCASLSHPTRGRGVARYGGR